MLYVYEFACSQVKFIINSKQNEQQKSFHGFYNMKIVVNFNGKQNKYE